LRPLRVCHALTLSNELIAKVITWLMTTNVLSGETTSIEIGTQKKPKKSRKLGLIQFA